MKIRKLLGIMLTVLLVVGTLMCLTACKEEITGIEFNDVSTTYDGKEKSIEITGTLPEGVTVTYANNKATTAGTYNATATLSGKGFEDLVLNATLTIAKADVDVSFEDATYTYDGNEKVILVSGNVPQGVTVNYTDNKGTDAGTYNAVAEIVGNVNYNGKTLNATLTVSKADITGITFGDATYTYDGSEKSVEIAGTLPEGASVTYTDNAGTDADVYNAVAHVSGGKNYNDLELKATLKINKATLQDITLQGVEVFYDGEEHEATIIGEVPEDAVIEKDGCKQTAPGSWLATVTITHKNYEPLILTANIVIKNNDINIDGITFPAVDVVYDGEEHKAELVIAGGELPDGVTVRYENNVYTDAGNYKAVAILSGVGFNDYRMETSIVIAKANLSGIKLESQSYAYDGKAHSLTITGTLPEGVEPVYSNNEQVEVGSYTVTATIEGGRNYNDLELVATLNIVKIGGGIVTPEDVFGD